MADTREVMRMTVTAIKGEVCVIADQNARSAPGMHQAFPDQHALIQGFVEGFAAACSSVLDGLDEYLTGE